MGKKHDWAALVEAHAGSGLTQKAFCEERVLTALDLKKPSAPRQKALLLVHVSASVTCAINYLRV